MIPVTIIDLSFPKPTFSSGHSPHLHLRPFLIQGWRRDELMPRHGAEDLSTRQPHFRSLRGDHSLLSALLQAHAGFGPHHWLVPSNRDRQLKPLATAGRLRLP